VKDDYFPEPQKPDAPESGRTQTESESTGNEESEPAPDDPEIAYLLKRLIEEEMLKQSQEDKQANGTKAPAANNDKVKTPLTFMTPPPPPPKDEDLSSTPAADSQESDEQDTSTTESTNTDTDAPSSNKQEQPDKSSSEEAFPSDENNTKPTDTDQKIPNRPSPLNKSPPQDDAPTSDENEIHQYAERFPKYQKEPQQDFDMRQSDNQQDEPDQRKEISSKISVDPEEDSREIETNPSTTPLPPTEDDTIISTSSSTSSETTQPDQTTQDISTIPPPHPANNGMDKVIFDKEEPSVEDSPAVPNSEVQEDDQPPHEKYYFFLRPRPTMIPPPSSFQPYQRFPSSRYTYTDQSQFPTQQLSPTYNYNPYLLRFRPTSNVVSSSAESSPQFMMTSSPAEFQQQPPQPAIPPSSSYQFQTLQPTQQQMLPPYSYDYDRFMANPMRPSFPPVFPPLQRPLMSYYNNYNAPSSGLGFSGDYMRNPYFWTNPYNSMMSMQVPQQQYQYQQRIPNAQLYYAF